MKKKESNLWIYDVEVYRNFFCVTFFNHVTTEKRVFEISIRKNQYSELENFIVNSSDLWLMGYNSMNYDDLIISWLIKHTKTYKNYQELCYNLWIFSTSIIDNKQTPNLKPYKYHKLFNTIDLQNVLYLNKPTSWKSLKACAVNLKWPRIQDLPIPFDQEIKEEEIDLILDYNENDVLITNRLREYSDEILTLRKELSSHYGLNLMNESNSSICNRILEKEYSLASGESLEDFRKTRTEYNEISIKDCIFWNRISFDTPNLIDFLDRLSKKTIKIDFKKENEENEDFGSIKIGKTTHVIGLGGLHSETKPGIFKAGYNPEEGVEYYIKTCDVVSYYPQNIINNIIYPKHLKKIIVSVIQTILRKRVDAKKNKRIAESEGLKIVINSFFGKFLSKFSWLRDPMAAYKVTINCQLYLLMLIEKLEQYGIHVISSNTDGLECLVPENKFGRYHDILGNWQARTGFNLEIGDYDSIIFRDINCYYATTKELNRQTGEVTYKVKEKGDFETEKTINKSIDFSIIYKALKQYFVNNIPVEDTIYNSEDILDFCASQKVGGDMKAELHTLKGNNLTIEPLQKTNRYFISNKGGSILKRKKIEPKEEKDNQLDLFEVETVEKEQLISMVANEKVSILNDVKDLNPNSYDIKHNFYIEECNKIINLIEKKEIKEEKKVFNQQELIFE